MSNPATLTDRDPLIQCDLMESRDAFLSFAHDNHCEFSTLRRAKYSTMVLLMKLQHEHRMKRVDEASETSIILIDTIRHAIQCQNKNCTFDNCALCKQLNQHRKSCTKVPRKQCSYCKRFLSPIWIHAKTCTDQNCRVRRKVFV
jgi:E1A/CREB-binding protein